MMPLFLLVCKFSSIPFGCVCVHRPRAQIVTCICVLASCLACLRNYMQSSAVNKVMKDVDFYRCMHDLARCHA